MGPGRRAGNSPAGSSRSAASVTAREGSQPIAAAPSLSGATVYFQWAIIDPAGQFVATFALSEGLKIRVGN